MATPRNSRTTKSWLDGLQQESWQLELVISGFSIFLLIGGWGWLRDLEYDLVLAQFASRSNFIFNVLYYVLRTAYLALLGCLLAHVVLRGLWIAAVGLRSVSGDIQYHRFRFRKTYVDRLQRRLGTFDDYNLIDNRFGRRLAVALPFIVVGILVAVSVRQVRYAYFPYGTGDGTVWVDHNNYDDEAPNPFDRAYRASLASKYVRNGYVEVFVPYRPAMDDERLLKTDSTLEVSQYVGTKLNGAFLLGERFNRNADYAQLLVAFDRITRLSVNDSIVGTSPRFHFHPERRQPGLLYVLPTHYLPVGEHRLLVQTLWYPDNGSPPEWSSDRSIYFYK